MLALTGCDPDNAQTVNVPGYITQTPALLRAIPISNLSVQISIDNVTKTYQGADFPDGIWQVNFDLEPNQTYDINIKWFALTHLLLEETGQIFTDPELQTITPELEFISAGFDRFDDDCDGQSNLDEIINGTSPGDAGATDQTACADGSEGIVLPEIVAPWINRQHTLFRLAGMTSRLTRYEQAIQITASNPNIASNFGMSLHTDPSTAVNEFARVDFRYDSLQNKHIGFKISAADDFRLSTADNAECSEYQDTGIECTIPFEWQEQQWYRLRIEAISDTSWQATVSDDTSGVSQEIATIETQSILDWSRAQNVLSYRQQIPSEQCSLGLEPISMRYKQGVANAITVLGSDQILTSDCVKVGGGWSEGLRTIDDELVYTLTLGRF